MTRFEYLWKELKLAGGRKNPSNLKELENLDGVGQSVSGKVKSQVTNCLIAVNVSKSCTRKYKVKGPNIFHLK